MKTIPTLLLASFLCTPPALAQATAGDPVEMLWMIHIDPSAWNNQPVWTKGCYIMDKIATVMEAHGGRMCVASSWHFLQGCTAYGNGPSVKGSIGDLASRGHEIAYHDHGGTTIQTATQTIQTLASPYSTKGWPTHIEGDGEPFTTLSGLGYKTKNGTPKDIPTQFAGIGQRPFRQIDGDFYHEDPNGLLLGISAGPSNEIDAFETDPLTDLTTDIQYAIAHHKPGKLSFVHVGLIHPDAIQNATPAEIDAQMVTFDAWLTQFIDPLVAQGVVVWKNTQEMNADYVAWEQAGGTNADIFPTPNVTDPAWSYYDSSNTPLPGDLVDEVFVDSQDRVWFGSGGSDGVTVLSGSTWTTYNTGNSALAGDRVTSIAEGPPGTIWMTTFSQAALNKLVGTTWTVYSSGNSPVGRGDPFVSKVVVDPAGIVWVGQKLHLHRFDGTSWLTYDATNGLPSQAPWAFAADGASALWIATRGAGIYHLAHQGDADPSNDVWTPYTHISTSGGIPDNTAQAVALDGAGTLYGGTRIGMTVFDGATWTGYTSPAANISNDQITDILIDGGGDVWLANFGVGVTRFTPTTGTFRNYDIPSGQLHNQYVTKLAADASGKIYASSFAGGGVSIYDPSKDTSQIVDYLVGQGLGKPNPNRVRVYTPAGAATAVDFLAYAAGQWGVNVGSGDVDGGAYAEILTGPGPGDVYGPQVRGFQRDGTAMGKINYYAYGTLRYGVNVAPANLDGDAYAEILTGAGPGVVFGPHVRGWSFDATSVTAIAKVSYFAYGTLKFGVNVGAGSVDADPYAEILTGPGPGAIFSPQVRGWNFDASSVTSISKINFNAFTTPQYGANVAGGDVDADTYAEMAAAPGPGATLPSNVRGFDYDGSSVQSLPGFDITPFTTLFGARIGLGNVSGAGGDDLLAGAGRDPAADSTVKAYAYSGSTLSQLSGSFLPFAGATYGVNAAGGTLGY